MLNDVAVVEAFTAAGRPLIEALFAVQCGLRLDQVRRELGSRALSLSLPLALTFAAIVPRWARAG